MKQKFHFHIIPKVGKSCFVINNRSRCKFHKASHKTIRTPWIGDRASKSSLHRYVPSWSKSSRGKKHHRFMKSHNRRRTSHNNSRFKRWQRRDETRRDESVHLLRILTRHERCYRCQTGRTDRWLDRGSLSSHHPVHHPEIVSRINLRYFAFTSPPSAPPNLLLSRTQTSDRAGLPRLPIQILPDGLRYLECDCANVQCRLNVVVLEDGFVLRYFIVTLSSDLEDGESFVFRDLYFYRDSQSWMSNFWWIRRLQDTCFDFQSRVYIFGRVNWKMVNFCICLSYRNLDLCYLECDCAIVECRLNFCIYISLHKNSSVSKEIFYASF